MKVELEIAMCRQCPNVTNSTIKHDDHFSSLPANNMWWCTLKNGPEIISNEWVIDKKCPIKQD